MGTARESFEAARSTHLAPALRELGFRVKSRTMWLRGSASDGWVVVDIGGNRHNTSAEGDRAVSVYCWPPGTWEWRRLRSNIDMPEPDSTHPPLYATVECVTGRTGAPRPDGATFTRDMSETDIARQAGDMLAYARMAIDWVENVLTNDATDSYTWHDHVLGSAQVTGNWTPARLSLLDELTAGAQRGVPSPSWILLAEWRAMTGRPPVPFPQWHHVLMHKRKPVDRSFDRFPSPRDKFVAGHGSAVPIVFADGSSRSATPLDFPDKQQLREWRKTALPVSDVPLSDPPPWLPWHDWVFHEPEPQSSGLGRFRRRR